jgi:phage terminase large subunit GpA-like protein
LSEVKVKQKSGRVLYEVKKGVRNENLDTMVYGLGALRILNPSWQILAKNWEEAQLNTPSPAGDTDDASEETFKKVQQQQMMKRAQPTPQFKAANFANKW